MISLGFPFLLNGALSLISLFNVRDFIYLFFCLIYASDQDITLDLLESNQIYYIEHFNAM